MNEINNLALILGFITVFVPLTIIWTATINNKLVKKSNDLMAKWRPIIAKAFTKDEINKAWVGLWDDMIKNDRFILHASDVVEAKAMQATLKDRLEMLLHLKNLKP
jgi:hypothetical protein